MRTNNWQNDDSNPYKAPNAIPLNRPYEPAQAGVALHRQLIEAAQRGAHNPPPPQYPPQLSFGSAADELRKLADLHADGVLSADEFSAMKARILGG
jgi:hypothetical protein